MLSGACRIRNAVSVALAAVVLGVGAGWPVPSSAAAPLPDKFLFQFGNYQPEVGQFSSPNAITVAPDGTVYVLEPTVARIQYFSPDGTFLGAWGSLGTGEGKFRNPNGIAAGPDGSVWVSDAGSPYIQRFDPVGRFLTQFPMLPTYASTHPNGIAVGPDGTIYLTTPGCALEHYSPTGVHFGTMLYPIFTDLSSITVAPNGTMYVVDSIGYSQVIRQLAPDGTLIGTWGPSMTPASPFGLAAAQDGTVYVAMYRWVDQTTVTASVQHVSAEGAVLQTWGGTAGSANGRMWGPLSLAVAPSGAVYVAEQGNARVQQFTATGAYARKWGVAGTVAAQLYWPSGVAVAPDGTISVLDKRNFRVAQYNVSGAFLGAWGSKGEGDGQFGEPITAYGDNGPMGIAAAPNGDLYVADTENNRIEQFTLAGEFIRSWGTQGSGDGQFFRPSGVAVSPSGNVYVADGMQARVQHFTPEGVFLGKWGSTGTGDGQFGSNAPVGIGGIAVAGDGTVYVTDTLNHRVEYFTAAGEFLGQWGRHNGGTVADSEFDYPRGIAVAPGGTVFVGDVGNSRVQVFSRSGVFLGKWGTPGTGERQFVPNPDMYGPHGMRGIAVDSGGRVYVSDTMSNRIEVFASGYSSGWRAEYFDNPDLAKAPVSIRQDASVSFSWGNDAPSPGVPSDGFSVRWTGSVRFSGRTYLFDQWGTGGVRVWVDGALIVDDWAAGSDVHTRTLGLAGGYHRVQVEYRHVLGPADVHLAWAPTGAQRAFLPSVRVGGDQ